MKLFFNDVLERVLKPPGRGRHQSVEEAFCRLPFSACKRKLEAEKETNKQDDSVPAKRGKSVLLSRLAPALPPTRRLHQANHHTKSTKKAEPDPNHRSESTAGDESSPPRRTPNPASEGHADGLGPACGSSGGANLGSAPRTVPYPASEGPVGASEGSRGTAGGANPSPRLSCVICSQVFNEQKELERHMEYEMSLLSQDPDNVQHACAPEEEREWVTPSFAKTAEAPTILYEFVNGGGMVNRRTDVDEACRMRTFNVEGERRAPPSDADEACRLRTFNVEGERRAPSAKVKVTRGWMCEPGGERLPGGISGGNSGGVTLFDKSVARSDVNVMADVDMRGGVRDGEGLAAGRFDLRGGAQPFDLSPREEYELLTAVNGNGDSSLSQRFRPNGHGAGSRGPKESASNRTAARGVIFPDSQSEPFYDCSTDEWIQPQNQNCPPRSHPPPIFPGADRCQRPTPATSSKRVLVLGGAPGPKPRRQLKPTQAPLRQRQSNRSRYNHYDNGGGLWDEDTVGLEGVNSLAGSWEGWGAATFGADFDIF